jgi:PASTA domain
VNLLNSGFSALGKLLALIIMAAAFLFGMASVVYMSLQGEEVKVPEIVGKDFVDSEKELESLGLKIKRRADRFSTEKPNTVLEQLPKAGETVKTGQMILVVISKSNGEADETPTTLKKSVEEDDSEKIEEMISEKPKKAKTNTNSNKKKADKTRDVIDDNSNSNSISNSAANSSEKKDKHADDSPDKGNKNTGVKPENKPQGNPPPAKLPSARTPGDARPRTPGQR